MNKNVGIKPGITFIFALSIVYVLVRDFKALYDIVKLGEAEEHMWNIMMTFGKMLYDVGIPVLLYECLDGLLNLRSLIGANRTAVRGQYQNAYSNPNVGAVVGYTYYSAQQQAQPAVSTPVQNQNIKE